MTLSRFKQLFLWSMIGFLSLSALVAIISLLSGDFGSTQIKIILTTLTISGASICGMACSAFIEKRGFAYLGGLGIAVAFIASVLIIYGMWSEVDINHYWNITISLVVVSAAFAHCLLLLIPTLSPSYRWSQIGVVILIYVLTIQVIFAIESRISQSENYYRLMGVVAVIVVLLTLIIPICSRLSSFKLKNTDMLSLSHDADDIYRDPSGQRYKVTKI